MPTEPPADRSRRSLDQRAETLWKWTLRGAGILAFFYVLIIMHGEVALGAWVIIGGLIGLPNALPLSQVISSWKDAER
jgi:hypothetical protein